MRAKTDAPQINEASPGALPDPLPDALPHFAGNPSIGSTDSQASAVASWGTPSRSRFHRASPLSLLARPSVTVATVEQLPLHLQRSTSTGASRSSVLAVQKGIHYQMNLTPKQLKIFNFVRQFRVLHGYSPTLQEIADELEVSKVTVFEHVEALVEKGALRRNPNKARSLSEVEDAVRPDEGAGLSFPLLGRIAAGMPIERCAQDERLQLEEIFGRTTFGRTTFGRTTARRGEMFALQVEGESMRDEGILDGDYVIVERRSTARSGERVVALLPNGETTLKSFYKEKNGMIRLQPANPEFEPIYVPDCTIQGVVIGVMRRY